MKQFFRPVALVAACIALAACTHTAGGPGGPASAGHRVNSWTVPHVLRYATGEDVNTLNPLLGQQESLGFMSSLTMAWLIKWDRHNRPYPELATEVPSKANGGVSKDGLTITYHLRKGVKWSDGAPFTADDVVWTIHAILNPANDVISREGWDRIKKIGEPNKYTVVLHLSKPYSPFIETFFSSAGANPCILPKHLLAKYPNINHVAYNSLPVGIGPFKYEAWDRGQKVVMVRNPYYWRGEPKLKEIDFEIVPDRTTVLTELEAKELDMWALVSGNYFQRAKALAPFTYVRQPGYSFDHLDFNLTRPRVKDLVVREALQYATNRAELIKKVGHGVGILREEPAPSIAPYYDPAIKMVPYDIAKANRILDAAGWKRGRDGIRAKNGVRLVLDFATSSGTPDVDEEIELIRQSWKKIGVGINVRHYPASLLFAPYAEGGIVYKGNWDVVGFQWFIDPIGDFSSEYACNQIPPNGQNDLHWCNAKADAAMRALYTHYDQAKRNKDDAIVMEQLDHDVPTIVTSGTENIYVFNRDLRNFHPNQVTPFDNMMDVDI